MNIFDFPSSKKINKITQKTTILSENLLKIIDNYNWNQKLNNSVFSSQIIAYFLF